jgi:hypothetical protein
VFSIFIGLDFIRFFGPTQDIHPRMNIENTQLYAAGRSAGRAAAVRGAAGADAG